MPDHNEDYVNSRRLLGRRDFLAVASGGVASAAALGQASAESLDEVPAREPGADLSALSARSKYVQIGRIPEAGPGRLKVDPADAINSKSPLQKLVGSITPSDLHYERSHSGVPDLDPAKHRLLVHGMVRKELVFTVDDLRAMPSVSRIAFLECTGNGWENWKKADPNVTEHAWLGEHERMDGGAAEADRRTRRKGSRIDLDARGGR
nr:molybdopterin-dependent oxidoreductase [Bradyrhizobium elkanii]